MFLSPVFTGSLQMLLFLDYSMNHISVERRDMIILLNEIFGQFLSEKENGSF